MSAPGQMLIVKANTGKSNPNPALFQVVKQGFKGVQEKPLAEGRHFYNPLFYKLRRVRRIVDIGPKQIGIVVSRSGKRLPEGRLSRNSRLQRHLACSTHSRKMAP